MLKSLSESCPLGREHAQSAILGIVKLDLGQLCGSKVMYSTVHHGRIGRPFSASGLKADCRSMRPCSQPSQALDMDWLFAGLTSCISSCNRSCYLTSHNPDSAPVVNGKYHFGFELDPFGAIAILISTSHTTTV